MIFIIILVFCPQFAVPSWNHCCVLDSICNPTYMEKTSKKNLRKQYTLMWVILLKIPTCTSLGGGYWSSAGYLTYLLMFVNIYITHTHMCIDVMQCMLICKKNVLSWWNSPISEWWNASLKMIIETSLDIAFNLCYCCSMINQPISLGITTSNLYVIVCIALFLNCPMWEFYKFFSIKP